MKNIAVLGCASVDSIMYMKNFPEPTPQTLIADRFYETVGSTGSGKALSLSKLGFDINFHAQIGDDYYGHKIINFMSKYDHLNFFYNFDVKSTQRHSNLMNERGQRISIFMQEASYKLIGDTKEVEKIINDADIIVLNIAPYCKDYIPLLKNYDKKVWCDLHDYDGINPYHNEFIDCADYLFLSSDNLPNYKEFMQKEVDLGKEFVVCTHGSRGACMLPADNKFIEVPIISDYDRIDTNGAGDNFMSGFMYAYLNKYNFQRCMQYGTIAAGLCINSPELINEDLSPKLLDTEFAKYYA